MIAEEFRNGGNCVIRLRAEKAPGLCKPVQGPFCGCRGFADACPASLRWPTLVAAKERKSPASPRSIATISTRQLAIEDSRAEIVDAHACVLCDGRKLSARIILISTGGAQCSNGYSGAEYAIIERNFRFPALQAYADCWRRLYRGRVRAIFARSARTSRLLRARKCVRVFDDDLRLGVRDGLAHAGSNFIRHAAHTHRKDANRYHVSLTRRVARSEQVMIATGRRPNTKGLGLNRLASPAIVLAR